MTGDRVAEIRAMVELERRAIEQGYSSPARWVEPLAYLLAELESANRRLAAVRELADKGADEYHYRTRIGVRGGVVALGEGYVRVSDLAAALNQGGETNGDD